MLQMMYLKGLKTGLALPTQLRHNYALIMKSLHLCTFS